jgi:hypothetical protein
LRKLDCALKEQHFRKKFNIRTAARNTTDMCLDANAYSENLPYKRLSSFDDRSLSNPPAWATSEPIVPPSLPVGMDNRSIEPMDIDVLRTQRCHKCTGKGHRAQECPTQQFTYPQKRALRGPRHVFLAEESNDDVANNEHPPPRQHSSEQHHLHAAKRLAQNGASYIVPIVSTLGGKTMVTDSPNIHTVADQLHIQTETTWKAFSAIIAMNSVIFHGIVQNGGITKIGTGVNLTDS